MQIPINAHMIKDSYFFKAAWPLFIDFGAKIGATYGIYIGPWFHNEKDNCGNVYITRMYFKIDNYECECITEAERVLKLKAFI